MFYQQNQFSSFYGRASVMLCKASALKRINDRYRPHNAIKTNHDKINPFLIKTRRQPGFTIIFYIFIVTYFSQLMIFRELPNHQRPQVTYFSSVTTISKAIGLSSTKNFAISSPSSCEINSLQRTIALALSLFNAVTYALAASKSLKAPATKVCPALKEQITT